MKSFFRFSCVPSLYSVQIAELVRKYFGILEFLREYKESERNILVYFVYCLYLC